MLGFYALLKTPVEDRQIGELESQELKRAKRIITCLAQEECFPDELTSVRNGRGIRSRGSVKSSNPILDTEGLLHVNGRLKLAENSLKMLEIQFCYQGNTTSQD